MKKLTIHEEDGEVTIYIPEKGQPFRFYGEEVYSGGDIVTLSPEEQAEIEQKAILAKGQFFIGK